MGTETVEALSVRDLVRRRCAADTDVWHLTLVQRDVTWDQIRMRYLLDSLLKGYPIGSLLVCQVGSESRVIQLRAGERVVEKAAPGAWQLLDGQQRINAFFTLFTPAGRCGHFYLNMTAPLDSAGGPVTKRRARDQSLRYIHWQDQPEAERSVPERDQHIDLSRWYDWAERAHGGAADAATALAVGPADTVRILNTIDPDFADRLDAGVEVAWRRLRRLLDIWLQPAIPVQYLRLGSAEHVLEVFTRLNRAGVQVAGEDLFFAAVKTRWNDAEQLIANVVARLGPPQDERTVVTPLIDRLGAFRAIARLAARAVGQADLVPLAVDRLSGARGDAVINAMQMLSDPDEPPVRRMAGTLEAVMRSSALGFGLYSVDERLWDDVLAWAAVNPQAEDPTWLQKQIPSIDAYLLGATSFRYPAVLRDRFSRLAITEALVAGMSEGAAFPTQRIAEVTRTLIPDLREGRTRIRGSSNDEQRLLLADANASLFLSVLQSIQYRPQRNEFDWDHIFPQAQARLMTSPGLGKSRRHHRYRHLVGSAGNLWGLHFRVNRTVQDLLPEAKFARIKTWPERGEVWNEDRWWLTADEISDFGHIGSLLERGDEEVEPAMQRFHDLVTSRASRMTAEVFERFPEAELFAADKSAAGTDPSRDEPIANALGIDITEKAPAVRGPDTSSTSDRRVQQVLQLADEQGSGATVREFVARALGLHLQVRGYQWTLTITPPTTKALALIAMTPDKERGLVKTWVAPGAFAEHFPDVTPERFDEELRGIRGSLLDGEALKALADRLEHLLAAPAPNVQPAESVERIS